jgi:hypothetical protein
MRRSFSACALILIGLVVLPRGNAAIPCSEVQRKFDRIVESNYNSGSSWVFVHQTFGDPSTVDAAGTTLYYTFPGCPVQITLDSAGNVRNKQIKVSATAMASPLPPSPTSRVQDATEIANAIRSLQFTLVELQTQISTLARLTNTLVAANPPPNQAVDASDREPSPAIHLTPASTILPSAVQPLPPNSPTAAAPSTPPASGCAENGSCYGDISPATGRPKTVFVDGYIRKDGTYVRGHVRSAPRRK